MNKIILIIPAFNEEDSILNVCNKIKSYKGENKDINLDYIVINDGSKDNTGKICKDNNINCINLINNLGIGGAVQTGYKYAYNNGYDIAVQFDGDGQHDIGYLKKLIESILKNDSDMVIGSRYIKGQESSFRSTKIRIVGKNIISFFIKIFAKLKITDPTSGFRAVNKKVLKEFVDYYPYDYPEPESIVYILKKGYRVKEVPVSMNERMEGKSSIDMFKSIHYMIKVNLSIIIESIRLIRSR